MDNNPIDYPIYHILLHEKNSNLQNLSLRNNQIDDISCEHLSLALGDVKTRNEKLITLNLSSNSIGDDGAKFIARVC